MKEKSTVTYYGYAHSNHGCSAYIVAEVLSVDSTRGRVRARVLESGGCTSCYNTGCTSADPLEEKGQEITMGIAGMGRDIDYWIDAINGIEADDSDFDAEYQKLFGK